MNKQQVLTYIKAYEKEMSGSDIEYTITDEKELKDGASLYLFEYKEDGYNIMSSAIGYEDGYVFVLTDWQGSRPETIDEVENYSWIRVDGMPAINFLGLPRILE